MSRPPTETPISSGCWRRAFVSARLHIHPHRHHRLLSTSYLSITLHRLTKALISLQPSIINKMASSSQVASNTLVTFKVNLDGTPRRFKLPLSDVGINVLENRVR